MLKISNTIVDNEYISNCQDTVFTMMVRDALNNSGYSEKFKKIKYIHGLLKYPKWEADTDIFKFISKEHLIQIQNKTAFFIFDASTEGFSPIHDFPFFDMLYNNCKKYNVDPLMVMYVSSNLQDEKNIKKYCKSNNKKPIQVFSFVSFEKVVRQPLQLKDEEIECYKNYKGKYFSSLSRVIRYYRSIATFLLCQDSISNKALISHNKFPNDINLENWKQYHQLKDHSLKDIKRWFKKLPLIVDKKDFNNNWAISPDYYHIHRKTLFQIVNETLVDNYNNTSLFYSEKTFRPIVCFQPFVIYGQKGCNKHLKNIGYKTYEDWFDLSFDDEENNVTRYKKLLTSVKETCSYLDSLNRDNQVEWRFKNKEILQHNFSTMTASMYSKDKLDLFLKGLDDCISNQTN